MKYLLIIAILLNFNHCDCNSDYLHINFTINKYEQISSTQIIISNWCNNIMDCYYFSPIVIQGNITIIGNNTISNRYYMYISPYMFTYNDAKYNLTDKSKNGIVAVPMLKCQTDNECVWTIGLTFYIDIIVQNSIIFETHFKFCNLTGSNCYVNYNTLVI